MRKYNRDSNQAVRNAQQQLAVAGLAIEHCVNCLRGTLLEEGAHEFAGRTIADISIFAHHLSGIMDVLRSVNNIENKSGVPEHEQSNVNYVYADLIRALRDVGLEGM